ncbi:MAG: hypothetical protein COV60_00985 [Candidatus Magasanikbacteria bacterium CG11_big_fil_rev_8_21_14_0_20_43_7]|uniref:Uncharacterized protein n=1 Tax=Candidatus Magasanikbacteria bacterium CG11_big_fil_rev_8_21_14_0_20_43_7 TaxID=1974654 RepID=A0A2H0N358_9BACT|nr:MAG: hypothetical protein COV60_00985 [Candidatus Magasanikbacteria bacterium CG11_big_fil_rev_8_21_14_0_20_43_7]
MKTVNLSYEIEPFGWKGPYVDREKLDRVIEHLREGRDVQISIYLTKARGSIKDHVSKVQEAWILCIDPYGVEAEIGRTVAVEESRVVIMTINHLDVVQE